MRHEVLGTSWTSSKACVSEVAAIATSVADILLLAVCTAEPQIDQLRPDRLQAVSRVQQIRLQAVRAMFPKRAAAMLGTS